MQPTRPPGPHAGSTNNPNSYSPTSHISGGSTPVERIDWLENDPVLGAIGPANSSMASSSTGAPRWDEDAGIDADVLADLFLGAPAPSAATATATSAPPRPSIPRSAHAPSPATSNGPATAPPSTLPHLEALILGHLPILGSAWLGGYAGLLAARHGGPIGIARLRGGHLTISAIGVAAPPAPSTLAQVLADLNAAGVRWLISADATDEPSLVRDAGPDGVTMLTSADDAAVVGAYQAIKGLLEPTQGVSPWQETTELTFALAGSTPERARASGEKLRSAVRTYLGRGARVEICPQKITPSGAQTIYSGAWDLPIKDLTSLLRSSLPASRTAKPTSDAGPLHARRIDNAPSTTPPQRTIDERRVPLSSSAPASPASALTSAIDGLTSLTFTCPYAPHIELALDRDGLLHLVAGAASTRDLPRVSAWARAHEGMFKSLVQGFGASASPVCHVVSEEPADLRPLIESDIRVHILVRGNANGMPFAVGRALN